MSEKPNDGAVAIHIGEIEDAEYLAVEDHLPTLPNTVSLYIPLFDVVHGIVKVEVILLLKNQLSIIKQDLLFNFVQLVHNVLQLT